MKYPSILNRLIIGLIVILSAFIFLSGIFFTNFKKINNLNKQIIDHPFTVSNALKDIYIGIKDIQRLMKDVAVAPNDSVLNEASININKIEEEVLQRFEIVKDKYLGDKNQVDNALQAFINWKSIRQEVINLSQQGKTLEAYEITTGKGAGHIES